MRSPIWISRRGADVIQPDNQRAGGVTEWMEIAAIADANGLELASHGGGATNLNMLLAMPNAIYMEVGRTAENQGRRSRGARRTRHEQRSVRGGDQEIQSVIAAIRIVACFFVGP